MKKIIVVLAISLLVGALVYGITTANNGNDPASHEVIEYEYASLGQECGWAATSYADRAADKKKKLEVNNADMQAEIAQTQAMLYGDAGANAGATNSARDGYESAYRQGYISKDEYDSKMTQLGQIQLTYGVPSSSAQQQLDSIDAQREQLYAEGKQEIADMESAAARLRSCAESANQRKDFTVGDVAEFETLINGVDQPE